MDGKPTPSNRPALLRNAARLQESLSALVRAFQSWDRARVARHGLSVSQSQALLALYGVGPLTVSALGEHLHLEKSTASRLAKALLQKGLVRKRSPASDDRKVVLQLTEQGMRLSRKVLNDLVEDHVELLEAMDPDEGAALPKVLDQLIRALVSGGQAPQLHDSGEDPSQKRFR